LTGNKLRDFQAAKALVELVREKGELDESTLFEFACARKYEEAAVALSLLSSASLEIIKPLMKNPRDDGLLIPCKAADCKLGNRQRHSRDQAPARFCPAGGTR
jgi:hypothetical protein